MLCLIVASLCMTVETSAVARQGLRQYSPRLGIYYELAPYGEAYGALLVEDPVVHFPLRQLNQRLERGDMITHLDNIAIRDSEGTGEALWKNRRFSD